MSSYRGNGVPWHNLRGILWYLSWHNTVATESMWDVYTPITYILNSLELWTLSPNTQCIRMTFGGNHLVFITCSTNWYHIIMILSPVIFIDMKLSTYIECINDTRHYGRGEQCGHSYFLAGTAFYCVLLFLLFVLVENWSFRELGS